MTINILVLEDCPITRGVIAELADWLNKKSKRTKIAVKFTDSIAGFKQSFFFGRYEGVILDDDIKDGNAFISEMPEWVVKMGRSAMIGLNSSKYYEGLAEKVNGFDLEKDPDLILSFLMKLAGVKYETW